MARVNAADRAAIATQIQGIQSQLLSLANLSYQGNYVFGGTATQTDSLCAGSQFSFRSDLSGEFGGEQRYFGQPVQPANQLARLAAVFRRWQRHVPEHSGPDQQPAERHRDQHGGHGGGRGQQLYLLAKRFLRQCP